MCVHPPPNSSAEALRELKFGTNMHREVGPIYFFLFFEKFSFAFVMVEKVPKSQVAAGFLWCVF